MNEYKTYTCVHCGEDVDIPLDLDKEGRYILLEEYGFKKTKEGWVCELCQGDGN